MRKKAKCGPKTKLNENLIKELCNAVLHGAYVETAAVLCGISKETFYQWLKEANGPNPSRLCVKLSDSVKKSMAQSQMKDLARIEKAAENGQWQAAAWRLERKFPKEWGRQEKVQVEHSGPDGKPIQTQHYHLHALASLTHDELVERVKMLREAHKQIEED